MTSAIPCKRPKVVVSPRTPGDDRHDADCHVPRCGWTYPADKQFMALKTDAEQQATRHRKAHRDAVPAVETIDLGVYHLLRCECGHEQRIHGTKSDVAAHLEHHLAMTHGLVSC